MSSKTKYGTVKQLDASFYLRPTIASEAEARARIAAADKAERQRALDERQRQLELATPPEEAAPSTEGSSDENDAAAG